MYVEQAKSGERANPSGLDRLIAAWIDVAYDDEATAIVHDQKLSSPEIQTALTQLQQKHQLDTLDAKLIEEKEDLQTWVLSVKLDEHKGTKKIECKNKTGSTENNSDEDWWDI